MVSISPTGMDKAVSNQLSCLVAYNENFASLINSNLPIKCGILYSHEEPMFIGETLFVPILATITIVADTACRVKETQVYHENFVIAFQEQSELPTSLYITSVGNFVKMNEVCAGKSKSCCIYDSIEILIA